MLQKIVKALALLDTHRGDYGLDDAIKPVVMGYASSAHLVALLSTDPHYLGGIGLAPSDMAAALLLDIHAYDVPYALQLMAHRCSELQDNIPRLKWLFGWNEADQLAASPSNYVASSGYVTPSVILSTKPVIHPFPPEEDPDDPGCTALADTVDVMAGYIAQETAERYAEVLKRAGFEEDQDHYPYKDHSSLVTDFGWKNDHPTKRVEDFLKSY
jgi:hypothetical protein